MGTLFSGFGITGYRSFHGGLQFIGPLRKVNLLAGQNNVGKSNVIRFLTNHLYNHERWRPSGLDMPRGANSEAAYSYALCLPSLEVVLESFGKIDHTIRDYLGLALGSSAFKLTPDRQAAWIRIDAASNLSFSTEQATAAFNDIGREKFTHLSAALTSTRGGGTFDDYNRAMSRIMGALRLPPVVYIGAFRKIRPHSGGETDTDYTGRGLVEQISRLQNPEAIDQPAAEVKYSAINEFVSSVLEEEATLIVPHSRSTLNIRMRGGVVLPLEHQGTGLHQVLIIATAATVLENTLVCIEEPEVNLHPVLQRRLLRYLMENTSNQYVIATHSAQMLDYDRATVLHLERGPAGTVVTPATTPASVANICLDLGYRPSDLLQANAVIWVEGPSDRIYLKYWIREADSSLVEGVHYSIMFYGGSLLRDLAFNDPAVTEFINLRRLNRHIAVVIDSDKRYRGAKLNPTKLRVRREFDESPENGFAWITDGYTIENYVPFKLLEEAVHAVHPRKRKAMVEGQWTNPLESVPSPNKAAIAREVVKRWEMPLADPKLKSRVATVIEFSRKANSADKVRVE